MRAAYVAGFGILGVLCRFGLNELVAKTLRFPFPAGTLFINVAGSFAIGAVYVLGIERESISESLRIGLMVGFLGGFTTFSAFSLETMVLWETKQSGIALAYFVLSPISGLLAAFAGANLTRALTS